MLQTIFLNVDCDDQLPQSMGFQFCKLGDESSSFTLTHFGIIFLNSHKTNAQFQHAFTSCYSCCLLLSFDILQTIS